MTETELNEQLAALLEKSEKAPGYQSRTGRRYRRRKGQEKSDHRLAIIQLSGYVPHRGYVDWDFEGRILPGHNLLDLLKNYAQNLISPGIKDG